MKNATCNQLLHNQDVQVIGDVSFHTPFTYHILFMTLLSKGSNPFRFSYNVNVHSKISHFS